MSEEQFNEETEVEGHLGGKVSDTHKFSASDEPRDEAAADDEVEGHLGGKTSHPKVS
jgi:hypothetical protein